MRSLAYVLLVLGCFATDLVSDIYLRSHSIPGTDPRSWDVITSLVTWFALYLLFRDRKD